MGPSKIIHLYMDFPLYTIQLLGYLHLWEPPIKVFFGDLTSLSYLDILLTLPPDVARVFTAVTSPLLLISSGVIGNQYNN